MKKLLESMVVLIMILGFAGLSFALETYHPAKKDNDGRISKPGKSIAVMYVTDWVSEGDTSDAFETTIGVVDPTVDRVIDFPNASGTVALTESLGATMSLTDTKMLVGQSTGLAVEKTITLTGAVTGTMTNSGALDTSLSEKGWSIMMAGSVGAPSGSATNTVTNHNINNDNILFLSYSTTDDTDKLVTVINSDHSVMTYVLSADPGGAHSVDYAGILENPSIGDAPWQIIGAFNSVSDGGDATETVSISGALTSDIVIASMEEDGTNDVTLAAARVSSSGTVTITLDQNPGTDARVSGMVIRPNSTDDTATHTIVFAANFTTSGGNAVEDLTVSGALLTDIVIAVQSVNAGQTLEFGQVSAADTLSFTFNSDPGSDEKISYMVLRAI